MNDSQIKLLPLSEYNLWQKLGGKRTPLSFDFEITARCNNNCGHCYINLPARDRDALNNELTTDQIKEIADEAVSLGALWCLITGGEPFLRKDFPDIYLYLKKKGLLVSVFTNGTLVTKEHIKFFQKYPPRKIEVSVYGATRKTYERVSRTSGSFEKFKQGLDLLLNSGLNVHLKSVALRSNISDFTKTIHFCRSRSDKPFRFDPFLHLRYDRNQERNREIIAERLLPREIAVLEKSDPERFALLQHECNLQIVPDFKKTSQNRLFSCGAGLNSFSVSYNGLFRLCPSLWKPDCVYDLKNGNLTEAWQHFVPQVRYRKSNSDAFVRNCRVCPMINLCMWCPAHAHLETGEMDRPIDYFCRTTQARVELLNASTTGKQFT